MSKPISRVLSWNLVDSGATIYLGHPLPVCLLRRYQSRGAGRPCKGLHGFIWSCTKWGLHVPALSPRRRCALTAPFHPCLL